MQNKALVTILETIFSARFDLHQENLNIKRQMRKISQNFTDK